MNKGCLTVATPGTLGGVMSLVLSMGLAGVAACTSTANEAAGGQDMGGTSATGGTNSGVPSSVGFCSSVNPFSKGDECKQYTGSGWTEAGAASDCNNDIMGAPGTFVSGGTCALPQLLGTCMVNKDDGSGYALQMAGKDSSGCAGAIMGCETFAKGTFAPGNLCDGSTPSDSGGDSSVFVQPYQTCKDPLPGEAPGQGPGGKVCTWTLVCASTEAGRHYEDYASCDDVYTQRPYYPKPPSGKTAADDPRLKDNAYMADVAWARQQVEASACICCHSDRVAPDGPGNWFVESPGVWFDSVSNAGIALFAGLSDSSSFGAFPSDQNNGFDRNVLGLPTNDIPRMKRIMLDEWMRRGLTEADAAAVPPFGGPLAAQQAYKPGACQAGQGVAADGTITWTGGSARYLYVLDAGSKNPGVPPNLDKPEGTRWFVDVPTKSKPFKSGLSFGTLSGDLRQHVPATGAPASLVKGNDYYLYVLADVALPITRCLFTMP